MLQSEHSIVGEASCSARLKVLHLVVGLLANPFDYYITSQWEGSHYNNTSPQEMQGFEDEFPDLMK